MIYYWQLHYNRSYTTVKEHALEPILPLYHYYESSDIHSELADSNQSN